MGLIMLNRFVKRCSAYKTKSQPYSIPTRLSCEFSHAIDHCLFDAFEVAFTQVNEEFFYRSSYLEPRMSPAHDAEHAVLVAHILNDISRVFQRKRQFVALHGEDTSNGFGQVVVAPTEVNTVFGSSSIADHVHSGNDAEL